MANTFLAPDAQSSRTGPLPPSAEADRESGTYAERTCSRGPLILSAGRRPQESGLPMICLEPAATAVSSVCPTDHVASVTTGPQPIACEQGSYACGRSRSSVRSRFGFIPGNVCITPSFPPDQIQPHYAIIPPFSCPPPRREAHFFIRRTPPACRLKRLDPSGIDDPWPVRRP
jgi:hypothetical protein